MTDITMQLFAVKTKMSVDQLIQWFSYLGIVKKETGIVTKIEKEIFFKYMNYNKSGISNKLTLRRKTRSVLSVSSIGGKNKQVQIEIRKKLTYIQSTLQETDLNDVKNKMVSNVNRAVSDVTVKSKLVNKKIDDTASSLLLTQISKKNNRCSESAGFKEKVTNKVSRKSEEKYSKASDEMKLFKNRSENHWRVDLNTNIISSSLEGRHNDKLHRGTVAIEKNHNQKLENERRHRSRVHTRYRSGGKLAKQHKRSNNHRFYEIIPDDFSKEELCIPNRTSKNKRKQSALLQVFNKPIQTVTRNIVIGKTISVVELANKMSIKSTHVIKVMMQLGIIVTVNQIIDQETAQLVVEEMGHNAILRNENKLEELIMHDRDIDATSCGAMVESRAPIVTIMGHVDHGKTSLLDRIRSTKIASSEIGGITQSIGAYHVNTNNGMITFLDTPGHAAFTAMRARGVQLTDIVVLVVAADDGVMPQTIEAIQHVKSANVPVVVAVNKIDKSEANPERIKNDLNNHGIVPEEWGGDVQFVNVSATSGEGIDNLLDSILLQSEILELKVIRNGMASAVVIESFLDKGRGPVVSVLVREGTLKCGDIILCGTEYGRVRAMRDEFGHEINSAGPSIPVELFGLSGTPASGEMVIVVRNEKKAREVAMYRQGKFREVKLARYKEPNVESIFANIKSTGGSVVPELNIIVKSDTQGSSEAIRQSLENLSTDGVTIKILSSSIGGITETDVALAAASNAVILGFNVRADLSARRTIELDRLDVRYYSVIYDLINEVKQAMHGMLAPQYKHEIIGLAEVRNVFCLPKYGNIAGCIVVEGMIRRDRKIRVIRDNVVVYEGELESLRRFKDDVNEVRRGIECGISIKNYNDIHSGDMIEVFDVIGISYV
ncbi:translation initiation factor IF-2 [Blochmannia endosymbiont of Camponotus nipponensis]|uniref:translation initiation factor IF-2 n=1 Tax=Blochmannia endosymbiont of Camponotus nipponensis TaxID=2681986 RepID=UPI00135B14CD|nr:translation initiation factor IF-2 [Blochmannia endosymbiont of Camponotus nipponensis]